MAKGRKSLELSAFEERLQRGASAPTKSLIPAQKTDAPPLASASMPRELPAEPASGEPSANFLREEPRVDRATAPSGESSPARIDREPAVVRTRSSVRTKATTPAASTAAPVLRVVTLSRDMHVSLKNLLRRFEDDVELGERPVTKTAIFTLALQDLLETMRSERGSAELRDELRTRPAETGQRFQHGYTLAEEVNAEAEAYLFKLNHRRGGNRKATFNRLVTIALTDLLARLDDPKAAPNVLRRIRDASR